MVLRGELEGRLDVFYYQSYFRELVNKLENGKFKYLNLYKMTTKITDGSHYSPISDSLFTQKYVTVKDLDHFGNINLENCLTISEEEFTKLVKTGCQPRIGDVLFSKDGTVGKTYTVLNDNNFVTLSSLAIITPNQTVILSKYLEFILRVDFILTLIRRVMGGSALQRIILQNISNLKLPVPPFAIQQEIISKFEAAYQAKREKEAEAASLLAGIDSYLLAQLGITLPEVVEKKKTFFVSSNKVNGGRLDPYYHQEEFTKLEEKLANSKYSVYNLREIALKITSGSTPLSGGDAYTSKELGIPFIRSGEINEFDKINFDEVIYIKQEVHNKLLKSSQLKKGDLMIAIVGATIGQVGIYNDEKEANINQAIALVRCGENINKEYLKSFYKYSIGQKILDRAKRPVARANINLEEIGNLKIILPPLNIQTEIAAYISNIRTKVQQLEIEAQAQIEIAKKEVEAMILGK